MASSKPINVKTRYHSVVTYASPESIEKVLREKSEQIVFAAWIFHDKDDNAPHKHVEIQLKEQRNTGDIVKWFKTALDENGNTCTTRNQPTLDCADMDDYLLHANDSTKHQYLPEDIKVSIGDPDDYRAQTTESQVKREAAESKAIAKAAAEDEVEQMLQDIIDMRPAREMARKYGRDYIKNAKAYRNYAAQIVLEETADFDKAYRLSQTGIEYEFARREALTATQAATKMVEHFERMLTKRHTTSEQREDEALDFIARWKEQYQERN